MKGQSEFKSSEKTENRKRAMGRYCSQRVAAKKEKAEETKRPKTKEAKPSGGEEVKRSKVKQEQEIIVEKMNQFKRADLCIV